MLFASRIENFSTSATGKWFVGEHRSRTTTVINSKSGDIGCRHVAVGGCVKSKTSQNFFPALSNKSRYKKSIWCAHFQFRRSFIALLLFVSLWTNKIKGIITVDVAVARRCLPGLGRGDLGVSFTGSWPSHSTL